MAMANSINFNNKERSNHRMDKFYLFVGVVGYLTVLVMAVNELLNVLNITLDLVTVLFKKTVRLIDIWRKLCKSLAEQKNNRH
ncbi:hypothetical protein [Ligilactobacillus equi]|uniref:Uncharacterized protein n=1 Tax=Ligilactobacillus equi DSM 15833 = JCM 10991 TaxID=1423740 RepID=A0A0R1TP75_9LACO|nr:hypothetical protein [Ligilactobacillus equi]KRL83247.1 hypothetical protein FC36_GL000389 [Ligilactobacillus equi DSM 15833 = JCM 10991]